jgi:hypothetical protein
LHGNRWIKIPKKNHTPSGLNIVPDIYAYGHALKDGFETSVKLLPKTAALSPGSFPMFRKLKNGFFPDDR